MSDAIKQVTAEQAKAIYDSEAWRWMPNDERAAFQLYQDLLCMPFDEFHGAVERALGRPVWTHEFAFNRQGLIDELLHGKDAPSLGEILGMLPKHKTILVPVDDQPTP